jgi:fermentation-respiration switch protein FrsA (DUF1100 family)
MPKGIRRMLISPIATVAGAFFLAVIGLLFFENSLIFFPTKGDVGKSPGEDVFLTTSDGVRIHGWYVTNPLATRTLLWFHGNAGNLENRRDWLEGLRRLPANVLIIDYRGYGKSDGQPNEAGVYRDARAAYDWLLREKHMPPEHLVIFGESLGGAVAAELATQVKCGGLVLQSTFTNAADMSRLVVPMIPMRWFIRSKFDTLAKVAASSVPKLILHARDDEVIPFAMGERLCAAARPPKECHWFDRGGHNAIFVTVPEEYFRQLAASLHRI